MVTSYVIVNKELKVSFGRSDILIISTNRHGIHAVKNEHKRPPKKVGEQSAKLNVRKGRMIQIFEDAKRSQGKNVPSIRVGI